MKAPKKPAVDSKCRETSRILEAFFSASINPTVILDRDFHFVQVNDAYAASCGRKPAELIGRNHFELYPNPENEEIFRRVVATKAPFQIHAKPFVFPDHPEWGTTYWDWSVSAILGTTGEVEFLVFSLRDVTDRALALERSRRNEELLRDVLEFLPVGVWLLDRTGRIHTGNRTVREIWAGAKLVGPEQYGEYKGWWADSGKPIALDEWAAVRAIREGVTTLDEEIEIEGFDGSRKTILNSAVPLRDHSGGISGAIIVNQDITERRREEATLRTQAAALDLALDAIFDCTLDGTILSWNRGAEMMYGWTRQEALGRVSHAFLGSRFPEPIERITETIIRDGRWDGEFTQVDRGGRPIKAAGRWALRTDAQGRPVGILKINIDITEIKKAEEALRVSLQNTRRLIEAGLDPMVIISPEGKITDVNKATELATEVLRKDLIGRDFSDFFSEPWRARKGYRLAFAKGYVRDFPLAIRSASGGVTDVLYNATIFRNESGAIQGVIATVRDITERKKAEAERLRLVKALEQAAEGIVILDAGLEILYVNPAFERISGLRAEDILRSTYDDVLLMTGETDGLDKRIREALAGAGRWIGRIRRWAVGSDPRDLEVAISPMLDESGARINFVAVERDVTEKVLMQESLRQAQKMEALGTLAGGIAHDFNNILMPILINAEMSLADVPERGDAFRQMKLILEAANRGKDLVKQIIAFSRRKEAERNPIVVAAVLEEGLRLLRSSIPKNIEIIDRIGAPSAIVKADATSIHQILMNLCSNAAYAMRDEGGTLSVRLAEVEAGPDMVARNPDLKPGPYIRLTVSDTGQGMTSQVQDRAFDPFFTTKGPGEGSGMGLAVVHGIVKSLGGTISIRSEAGSGSDFEVFLPRIEGSPAAEPEPPAAPAKGRGSILYIDDEEILIRSIPPMIERLGYQVTALSDAVKALEAVRNRPQDFDLVITDQMMPSLTGLALFGELRRIRPDLPVILCSGFSEAVDEARAKSLGFAAFLMKPFSAREIAEVLRRALRPQS